MIAEILGEKNILLDATLGDPRCSTHVNHASVTQGHTIRKLSEGKIRKYDQHCKDIGATFHAAAFEIFGSTSEATEELITKLVRRAAERRHIPLLNLFSFWRKRISTAIQMGNAMFLLKANSKILNRAHGHRTPAPEAFHLEVMRERVHVHH